MNYQLIHDTLIERARTRQPSPEIKYHKHHVSPVHEGGPVNGPLVLLTLKEHWLVHKLRYKFTGSIGNLFAFNLLKYGVHCMSEADRSLYSREAAKKQHREWKQNDPEGYSARQRKAGIAAGQNSKIKQLGMFSLSEDDKKRARDKGRQTTVENKIGMFSDEYRAAHRLTLFKPVTTPHGNFDSMTEAALFYGVSPGTITYRVSSNSVKWAEWKYKGSNK